MRPYQITWNISNQQYIDTTSRVTIDLDHVLAITEPHFEDRMGFGGYFAEFEIILAFRDTPLVISTRSDSDHSDRNRVKPVLVDGSPEGVSRLMNVYNALLDAWTCKNENGA